MAFAILGLLCGVVCGAANSGSASGIIPLPEKKPVQIAQGADQKRADQTEPTSLTTPISLYDAVDKRPDSSAFQRVSKVVMAELRQGRPTYALKLLKSDPMAQKLKNSEFDRIKAQIAQSYLIEGQPDKALDVARDVIRRSGVRAPLASWVAGQAAWRSDDFKLAAQMFAITARSTASNDWLASGGAYWAARAYRKSGQIQESIKWQEKAAEFPRTFYGMIAQRALGEDHSFNWDTPDVGYREKKQIASNSYVQEALRLSKVGKLSEAINALGKTPYMKDDASREKLLAHLMSEKDPALTLHVARKTKNEDGQFFDVALFPEVPWEPTSGYQVDKALIFALIRQESHFNPVAVSSAGAKGLMQILPSTAQYVLAGGQTELSNPARNIEVGQKYVRQLLKSSAVNNDLFKMAIAYNAGPGNLAKWQAKLKDIEHDPLLFIETIPSAETRAYVERVMLNYWAYRLRMGEDVPSLDAIIALDDPSLMQTAARMGSDIVAMVQ